MIDHTERDYCAKRTAKSLVAFVERAASEKATAEEVEVLPAVAQVLLNYFSAGVLDTIS